MFNTIRLSTIAAGATLGSSLEIKSDVGRVNALGSFIHELNLNPVAVEDIDVNEKGKPAKTCHVTRGDQRGTVETVFRGKNRAHVVAVKVKWDDKQDEEKVYRVKGGLGKLQFSVAGPSSADPATGASSPKPDDDPATKSSSDIQESTPVDGSQGGEAADGKREEDGNVLQEEYFISDGESDGDHSDDEQNEIRVVFFGEAWYNIEDETETFYMGVGATSSEDKTIHASTGVKEKTLVPCGDAADGAPAWCNKDNMEEIFYKRTKPKKAARAKKARNAHLTVIDPASAVIDPATGFKNGEFVMVGKKTGEIIAKILGQNKYRVQFVGESDSEIKEAGAIKRPGMVLTAFYDYSPQEGDEIQLKKNGKYWVTKRYEDGWVYVKAFEGDEEGKAPVNYFFQRSKIA